MEQRRSSQVWWKWLSRKWLWKNCRKKWNNWRKKIERKSKKFLQSICRKWCVKKEWILKEKERQKRARQGEIDQTNHKSTMKSSLKRSTRGYWKDLFCSKAHHNPNPNSKRSQERGPNWTRPPNVEPIPKKSRFPLNLTTSHHSITFAPWFRPWITSNSKNSNNTLPTKIRTEILWFMIIMSEDMWWMSSMKGMKMKVAMRKVKLTLKSSEAEMKGQRLICHFDVMTLFWYLLFLIW